jgi:hypothetical protein
VSVHNENSTPTSQLPPPQQSGPGDWPAPTPLVPATERPRPARPPVALIGLGAIISVLAIAAFLVLRSPQNGASSLRVWGKSITAKGGGASVVGDACSGAIAMASTAYGSPRSNHDPSPGITDFGKGAFQIWCDESGQTFRGWRILFGSPDAVTNRIQTWGPGTSGIRLGDTKSKLSKVFPDAHIVHVGKQWTSYHAVEAGLCFDVSDGSGQALGTEVKKNSVIGMHSDRIFGCD